MNIAGVLVHAYPGEQDRARTSLAALAGVELHHETDDGRFIVTVEDQPDTPCGDTIMELQSAPGIASAALAYHSFEPDEPTPLSPLAGVSASPIRGA